jgi:hypothetical protein
MEKASRLDLARFDFIRRKVMAGDKPCGDSDDTLRRVGEEIRTLADLYRKLKDEHGRTLAENKRLREENERLRAGK